MREFKYTITGLNIILTYLEQEFAITMETLKYITVENGFNKKQIRKHRRYLKNVVKYLKTATFVTRNYLEKLNEEEGLQWNLKKKTKLYFIH